MSLTKLDIDRFISTLRTKSKEFNSISNVQLASMLEETVSNIKEVSFFWATICSDNKGTTKTPAEGEEWLGGPFASVLATQYYINSLTDQDDLNEKKLISQASLASMTLPTSKNAGENSLKGFTITCILGNA